MIIKFIESKIHTLGEGVLTDFHISNGYIEVDSANIKLDVDGELFSYYKLVGDIYEADTVKINADILEGAKIEGKALKIKAVSEITVNVDGIVFDGDEDSQNRMMRAIQALVADEEMDWIVADNNIIKVNQTILGKALRLAGEEMTRIWTT